MNASQACESPYSVNLSIKKTFTMNKDGESTPGFITNFFDVLSLINVNQDLVRQRNILMEHATNIECQKESFESAAYKLNLSLEKTKLEISELSDVTNNLAKAKETSDNLILEKQNEISELKIEFEALQSQIKSLSNFEHRQDILENTIAKNEDSKITIKNNKDLKDMTIKLNKELAVVKTKFMDEKTALTKQFRTEVKYWRKELGLERSLNIRMEKELKFKYQNPEPTKLFPQKVQQIPMKSIRPGLISSPYYSLNLATMSSSSDCANLAIAGDLTVTCGNKIKNKQGEEILCTICAEPIINYIPKYFLGMQMNPACADCDDTYEDTELDEQPG